MTFQEVMRDLEAFGNAQTKKVLLQHGAKEPFFGVKVQDLKKIVKNIKKDHKLSLELYNSGNSDAMYLAGLIADEKQITKAQLQQWVKQAYWYYISDYTVPWVAAESHFGWELAMEWIESEEEFIASAGWNTFSSLASLKNDEELDIQKYRELLLLVESSIHDSQNRVRYSMNGFVIAVGSYISELTEEASLVAQNIGKVIVQLGGKGCKVPLAKEYIQKVADRDRIGKKRKSARC